MKSWLPTPDDRLLRAVANGGAVLLRADETWKIFPDRPVPLYRLAPYVGERVAVIDCGGTCPTKATVMLIDTAAARLKKPINRRGVILVKGAPPNPRRIVRGDVVVACIDHPRGLLIPMLPSVSATV